jgi:hypothetical protein
MDQPLLDRASQAGQTPLTELQMIAHESIRQQGQLTPRMAAYTVRPSNPRMAVSGSRLPVMQRGVEHPAHWLLWGERPFASSSANVRIADENDSP